MIVHAGKPAHRKNAAASVKAQFKYLPLILLASTVLTGTLSLTAYPALAQSSSNSVNFAIASQPLASAVDAFSAATGWQVGYPPASGKSVRIQAVTGAMTPAEALQRMVAGTGLNIRITGPSSAALIPASNNTDAALDDGSVLLDVITVHGANADLPYSSSDSSAYITGEQIERYKGTSPADILKGAPGVYSGQSRASGGIDANIRGLQGQGRVPVTVDGAQNSTSMYRGYQGIANSTFIDPDFIGGIAIEKGPSNSAAGAGAIGGMVSMRTLNADDIIPEGESFGARMKFEGSSNSSSPWSSLSKRHLALPGERETADYIWKRPESKVNRPSLFDLSAGSASIVLAGRGENFDILGGFSRRVSGNYHAGKNGSNAPQPADCDDATGRECAVDWYKKGLSIYLPGEEVLNTSQNIYSGLLKGTFRFADDHSLELGYSLYDSRFGEQYALDLASDRDSTYQRNPSHIRVNNYTSRYRWNPDNDLIDLKWNAWGSWLDEQTHTNEGSISKKSQMRGTDISNTSRFVTSVGDISLQYGLSYLYEETKPIDVGFNVAPRDGERWEASAFTNSGWQALDWLKLDTGLRYHWFNSRNNAPNNDDPKQKDGALDYSGTVTVTPLDGWNVYGSYKHASRLPSLFESTGGFATLVDPDLKPETAKSWEIGTNLTKDGVLFDDDSLRFKVSYFDSKIHNYINRMYQNRRNMLIRNIDLAKFAGFDLSARYERDGFSAEVGGSYYTNVQYCETSATCINSSLASDYATNYIPPKYQLNLTLTQKMLDERLELSGRLSHIGKRAADAQPPASGGASLIAQIPWKPYTLLDIYASYKLSEYAKLSLAVENLTDVYYVEPLSLTRIPSPGRTFRIGLTTDFSASSLASISGNDKIPARNWSGFYMGLHAAAGSASYEMANYSINGEPPQNYNFGDTASPSFGGQLGYDYQFGNNIVVGISGEFSRLKSQKDMEITGRQRAEIDANWVAGIYGRVGYAIHDILVYAKAGYSVADMDAKYESARRVNGEFVWSGASDSARLSGWTASGGIEYALTKKISISGEYSFTNLSHGGFNMPEISGTTYSWDSKPRLDQVKFGLNYRF
ncbi:TonB-dependent receptor domain-containing protein [Brucellaceae bacterium C25G]